MDELDFEVEARPTSGREFSSPRSFMGLVWLKIPAGEFWMGAENGRDNEKPCHLVHLPTYWIAQTPITNSQYALFLQATGHLVPFHWENGQMPQGKGNHPVVNVSWEDVVALAKWVETEVGQPITLPNEAEWEKAARGGLVLPNGRNRLPKRRYPWGNVFNTRHCNTREAGLGETNPVDKYPHGASPYGVLEMSGNVWEWVRSRYEPYPYVAGDGREDMSRRNSFVLRGGAWNYQQELALVSYRNWDGSGEEYYNVGVRLVAPSLLPVGLSYL